MANTKLVMATFLSLSMAMIAIGCGRGEETPSQPRADQQPAATQPAVEKADAISRIRKYAPKDASTIIYADAAKVGKGLSDAAKRYPVEASQIAIGTLVPSVLDKIDAVVIYMMQGQGPPLPVIVFHGDIRPGDLAAVAGKIGGGPAAPEVKIESRGNGRYALTGMPFPLLVIDAGEADDLDGNVLVAGMPPMLTAGFIESLGKAKCPAVEYAIEKSDTSSVLWGAVVFGKGGDPNLPESGQFAVNVTGDKLFDLDLTFATEAAAKVAAVDMQDNMSIFSDTMTLRHSGTNIRIKSTQSGNLIDLILIPSIRQAVELAKQASCLANVKGIARGCMFYRAEQRNKYPPDLKTLVDMDFVTTDAFKCRSDQAGRDRSYLYVAPTKNVLGETIMLCELKGVHKDRRSVGFADGSVTAMTEAQLQAALKLPQNAAFAEALKKAEK